MYRIVKKPKGFIVEKEIAYWTIFGLKYKWIPYIKSSGLDCIWYHSTYEFAMMNLLSEVKRDCYKK